MCQDSGEDTEVRQHVRGSFRSVFLLAASLALALCSCGADAAASGPGQGEQLALVEDSVRAEAAPPTTSIPAAPVSSITIATEDEYLLSSSSALVRTWPMEFPLPASAEIFNSTRIRNGDYFLYSVDFSSTMSFEEIVGHFAVLTDGLFVEHEQLSGEPGNHLLNRRLSDGPNLSITVVLTEDVAGSAGTIAISVFNE